MTPLLILNDVHLGAVRSAGTTLATRKAIQDYLQQSFRDTVNAYQGHDLLIAGDLFDAFNVDVSQVLQAYFTLADWLKDGLGSLHLMQGNHDVAKNSEKTSSFAFLCALLTKLYPDQVHVYTEGLATIADPEEGMAIHLIPHCVNQDLFDIELERALHVAPGFLILHANCMNHFAEQADHSLNISEEWVDRLIAAGHVLVFAHEHQARHLKGHMVNILGNQWPSSVSDCLEHNGAQKDGVKRLHVLMDGAEPGQVVLAGAPVWGTTWDGVVDYAEVNWREIETAPETARFIRVTGTATTEEASAVISTISRFRQDSAALVISNAVKIAGVDGLDELSTLSAERLAAVDVMAALCEELEPEEIVAVKRLLED